jgi:hypothetical protein
MQNPSDAVSALPVPTATNPSAPQLPRDGESATTTHRLRPHAATATHSTRHCATDGRLRATNCRPISNAVVVGPKTCPPMRVPPSSNSRRGRTGPTFATVEPALRNSDPWRQTAAFALSKSMRIVCCMMAQQLPVRLYRIGKTMDEIWSRVNAINAITCVMWDESGSRRWRAEQLAKVIQWSSAYHWNRLLTTELVGLSNKD